MIVRMGIGVLLAAGLSWPASGRGDLLIVLNKSEHEAALVDAKTLEVVAKLPTGKGPHEVAVSRDGRTAWVSDYGAYNIFKDGEAARYEPGKTITVLDLERRTVRDTFDLGELSRPHGIRLSRDGTRLWVTCEGAKAVAELDAASGQVLRTWDTGQEVSHMVIETPDERKLYVANIGSGSVTVIDRTTNAVKNVVTGKGAEGIDVSPDGREVWVTNRADHTIAVLDTRSDRVVATVPSGGEMPIRLKFTPDGREAWVSNARSSSVTVFDAKRRTKLATLEVGSVPVGIEIAPGGGRAFVACTNDDRVKLLDLAARRVAGEFTTGKEPDGMAWVRSATARPAAGPGR
jgi:YVTN family beta-propeller protein